MRAAKVLLFAALALGLGVGVASATGTSDFLSGRPKAALIPVRLYRAATFGGYTDSMTFNLGAGASDTTAPISMANIGIVGRDKLTGSGGEFAMRAKVVVSNSVTFSLALQAQFSPDGVNWTASGASSTVPGTVGKVETFEIGSSRTQAFDLSTFSDPIALCPYVRFVIDNTAGTALTQAKFYLLYFSNR